VWTGKPKALDNPAKIEDSEKWVAGIVVIKPTVNTSFRRPEKKQQAGSFADVEMEEWRINPVWATNRFGIEDIVRAWSTRGW
jgi:hypothetical protein